MTPQRLLVGNARSPVLLVDETGVDCAVVRSVAAALAPFPAAANNYPGLRRILDERDGAAWAYVVRLLQSISPYLAGAFDLDGFELTEASFSLVTTPPDRLAAVQRTPHFDSVDPDVFAVMQYLAPFGGTAFYRHRESGIETVTPDRLDAYVAMAKRDCEAAPPDFIRGDSESYQALAQVEGLEGRVVAYPGRLLHSGLIPKGFRGSADPRTGRLTCNIFLRGKRHG